MTRIAPVILLLTAAASAPAPTSPAALAEPAGRIILFGATWCAPCRAERAEAQALAAAAAPWQVTLAWIDRPITAPAGLDTLTPGQAERLARQYGGEGFGLPFAVAVDATGHACGLYRGPLRAAAMPVLLAGCGSEQK